MVVRTFNKMEKKKNVRIIRDKFVPMDFGMEKCWKRRKFYKLSEQISSRIYVHPLSSIIITRFENVSSVFQ